MKDQIVTVRLDTEDVELLDREAASRDSTRSLVLRELIQGMRLWTGLGPNAASFPEAHERIIGNWNHAMTGTGAPPGRCRCGGDLLIIERQEFHSVSGLRSTESFPRCAECEAEWRVRPDKTWDNWKDAKSAISA